MPATFSPRAASDAGACVRRFFLHRVDRSPDWAPDRTRSSVHEVVAQLVRVVELAGRDIPPDDRDAEAAEARLLDGARRALRGICDAQRELIESTDRRSPSASDLRVLVEEDHLPLGVGLPRLIEEVDVSTYSRASARLLRGAVGVLTNMHARWVRLGRVELLDPSELPPIEVGQGVLVRPDVHLLYRRPDGRVVAVLWRTGMPSTEHRHHAALVESALHAAHPAVGVACVNVYTWDAHEVLLSEEDREAAPAHWDHLAAEVRRALDAGEAPPPLALGSKPCVGCRVARPCGRS